MISNFGSSWCSLDEDHYLTLVGKDLASFSKGTSVNRVLIFPPLSSRYRFLLHKVVERLPELKSCSVGSEPYRRTVVYFEDIERIHKAQRSMDGSKLETEAAPKCNPCGRGRGRGIRARGEKQCDYAKNSPTASRRPAQALYTPGAFMKKRNNTENPTTNTPSLVDPSGNTSNENNMPKSCTSKIQALNEKCEKSPQVAKSISKDQHDNEYGLKSDENTRNSTLRDERCSEYNLNALQVSSPSSSTADSELKNTKEKVDKHGSLNNLTSKSPDYVDSNCDTVINSPQLCDSTGQSHNCEFPVSTVGDNNIMSPDCEKKEEIFAKIDNPSFNGASKTIQYNYDNRPIIMEMPTENNLGTNSSELNNSIRGNASGKGLDKRKNVIKDEEHAKEEKNDTAGSVLDHFKNNVEYTAEGESNSNIHDNNADKEMSRLSQALGDLNKKVDKGTLEKKKNTVCIESAGNSERQSMKKRQFDKPNLDDKDDKIALGHGDDLVHSENEKKLKEQSENKDRCHKNLSNYSNVEPGNHAFVHTVKEKLEIKNNVNNKDNTSVLENNDRSVDSESDVEMKSTYRNTKEELNCVEDKIGLKNDSLAGSESKEKVKPQNKGKRHIKQENLPGKNERQHNDESIESEGTVETQINVNEQDKVIPGNNESAVNKESKEKADSNSKSKRQHKKDEKAKKKEEKLKKKQVKTKSEKAVKKIKGETCDLEKKENANKEVKKHAGSEEKAKPKLGDVFDSGKKNEVDKQDNAKREADIQEVKVVRECKDTLLKVSIPENDILNDKDSGEDDDWERTWNDDGECLDANLLAELNEKVDATNIQVVKPQFDYLSFKPNDIILENGVYDHVVELYDFSPEFKNHDLINALSNFKKQGFDIKWVDDTHALAVFSNHRTAQQAIEQCCNPMLKLRSLYEGTQMSKLKAKRAVDVLRPYKERPKTTKLVANRLVAGALGMKSKMSKEERQLEREKIKAERERKLNREKQKKDLWESDDL